MVRTAARRPGLLDDPEVLGERVEALGGPGLQPLLPWIADLRARHGAVPWPDPLDGGAGAKLLLLLETPGPGVAPLRFVSRDNPTGTGRNLRRFLDEAGWRRADTLIWNVVPWIIHADGALNRAPTAREVRAGVAELPGLLALLPRLAAIVLAGKAAASASAAVAPFGRPVFRMPHPSPTSVCTSPDVAVRIAAALKAARDCVPGCGTLGGVDGDHDRHEMTDRPEQHEAVPDGILEP